MISFLGFLIILGPLVIVHEFGHYFFARVFGVKAEIFSVGFGPRLWKKQLGETELRISAIPLGGYVKLLGEERDAPLSPEDQKRALHRQAPWKRFFIFFGGPLFNFLFAIVVFMVILVIGEQQTASVIGRVVHGSVAEKAGFQSGDVVQAINGTPVRKYEELMIAINENPRKAVEFSVLHPKADRPTLVTATPEPEDGLTMYGESKPVGEIQGLQIVARAAVAGVSNPASPAGKAGIATGDTIVSINGLAVATWEELESEYRKVTGDSEVKLAVKAPSASAQARTITLKKPAAGGEMPAAWGLCSSELFVDKTIPKSPAEAAGVQHGDRLVSVGTHEVPSFLDLKDAVQHAGESEGRVRLQWERNGKLLDAAIVPTATTSRDALLKKTVQYTVGVVPMMAVVEPPMVMERVYNPFVLLFKGTERMVSFTWRNLVTIQKMFFGDVSVATLGGPIMIGKIAGESLVRGVRVFLHTMAILSIGLGVLNVLPVPVLDGGHLMLLTIEIIRGKPLAIRTMEIIQLVGLSLILLLMAVVIKNDLTRLPYF